MLCTRPTARSVTQTPRSVVSGTYYDVDFLGVLVLGFSTALFGGVIRDVIVGDTPPSSFRTPTYSVMALSAGVLVLVLDRATDIFPVVLLQVVDALGLGLFAVVGAVKALDSAITPLVAALLGTVSAVGGGVVSDMMLNIVPVIMRGEIYAVAALRVRPWRSSASCCGCPAPARWWRASRSVWSCAWSRSTRAERYPTSAELRVPPVLAHR